MFGVDTEKASILCDDDNTTTIIWNKLFALMMYGRVMVMFVDFLDGESSL